ncbi:MAG: RnfABCDGE type electron transport complex subunit D [Bdellovibrionaceae bacterium]|nr:RnfABCDGE type electron transport complex subunit D [Bdellovibrionales bacterium]MCB9086054.1 RnfABCDGE type electron transport complex subunit D [Pseudobdellovibrionaceae bacterium]
MNRGPFIHRVLSTRTLMWVVVFALSLTIPWIWWRHGVSGMLLLALAMGTTVTLDFLLNRFRFESSSVVTGFLVALLLPAYAPPWLAVFASSIAVVFGRWMWGGLGKNKVNPAVFSRVAIVVLFPQWYRPPLSILDTVTRASPLAKEMGSLPYSLSDWIYGNQVGSLAEAFPLAVFGGGLLLCFLRVVDWRVPLYYLASITFFVLLLPGGDRVIGHADWAVGDPLFHIFSGGVPLAAFFLLTDPVTSPFWRKARIRFAVIAGLATVFVRYYTPYPDGVGFAVLICNLLVPLLDILEGRGTEALPGPGAKPKSKVCTLL